MAPITTQGRSQEIELAGDKLSSDLPVSNIDALLKANSNNEINTNMNAQNIQLPTLNNLTSKQQSDNCYSKKICNTTTTLENHDNNSSNSPQQPKALIGNNPSWRSWIAAANTMMGSSIVVFPAIFKENGIISSFITMFVVGAFLYKTCIWCVKYCQPHERDLYDTIERLLGHKWKTVYTIANSLLLFLVSIIYFLLFNSFFYPLLKYLLEGAFQVEVASRDEVTFDKFSYQWCGIATISFFFLILAKRDLSFIMKITQFGLLSVGVIVVFAIAKFGVNVSDAAISLDDTPLFTKKIYNLIGVFILSFQIHCLIIPILRDNKDPSKNERDTFVSYVITFITYILISLFGVLAISGKSPVDGNPGDTILEYFSDRDIFNIIVRFGLCIYIVGVYPIITFGSRSNFFSMVLPKEKRPSNLVWLSSNLVYCGFGLAAILTNVNLNLIMSIAGYVVSFFIVILLPILIRIKGGQLEKEEKTRVAPQQKKQTFISTEFQTQHQIISTEEISPKNKLTDNDSDEHKSFKHQQSNQGSSGNQNLPSEQNC